jgi:exopolyphosphatase/guanosine-5'-triphosphate,3'-diphosphate pyrophosphatase
MRVAIIDLGTNSVRFDVHQLAPRGRAVALHREKLMIRLGQGLFLDGKLDPNAVRRTLEAFISFHRTATLLHADKVVAFGTSALREANDAESLLSKIRRRTAIDVRVISGEEEAKLIAEGILANEKPVKGRFALVDIGGGSTEISVCERRKVLHASSFALGTARLQEVFLKTNPPTAPRNGGLRPIEQLRRYIKSVLLPKFIADDWAKAPLAMGSSGTIRALSKIMRKLEGTRAIERKGLARLVEEMSRMTTTELLGIPGMEAKRVDMILAGAILLEECMDALGAKKMLPTNFSLRDGILNEELRLFSERRDSHISFHMEDLYRRAKRLGANEPHLRQVVAISEALFDRLRAVHKLKPSWKPYLTAAAILHDVGESVTPSNHEQHSYYIVKNADIPSMEKWETEFVAQLCLWHRGGKVSDKDMEAVDGDKERKHAFLKLLAILRIADALDRGHKSSVTSPQVKVERGRVRLRFASKSATDLEMLRVEQKKALFEQVFGRSLIAERL